MLVTLLVLGVFIPMVQAATSDANAVSHRVQLDAFMKSTATRAQEAHVRGLIARTPHVKAIVFVSKAEAYAQQRRSNPTAFTLLGNVNPLPDKFSITPDQASDAAAIAAALTKHVDGHVIPIDTAIGAIKNRQRDADKIVKGTHLLKVAMGALIVLLIIASILLISNTIRLSQFSRRREVEVMKLVGATDWFIRWPFIIEGVVLGAFGAIGAAALLLLAKLTILDSLKSTFKIVAVPNTISVPVLAVVLLACSVLVSAVGSGLSLRRFLRV